MAGEVKQYDYDPATNAIMTPGDYAAGTLKCTVIKDQQDFETREYTDMLGQMVCRRVFAADAAGPTPAVILSTYYVYDDLGLLRAVLQPNFQDDASFTNSAFLYDYDDQGRMTRKQVPGAGSTEYVYDKFDHAVLSRDANQTARNVWAFTKYDELNRPVMTGELNSDKSRSEWQAKYDVVTGAPAHHENRQGTTGLGYTLNLTSVAAAAGFPQIADTDVLTVTYYDDYDFPKPAAFVYSSSTGYPASENTAVKSLVTGGRVRVLPGGGASPGNWLVNVVYYDAEYRPIQTVRELHDLPGPAAGSGANERISTLYKYDLAAVVAEQKTVQTVGTTTNTHIAENTYDHADRLLGVKETVSFGSKTKTAYTLAQRYNTLGQLQSRWFHAYASDAYRYRRRTTYTNNILGWLTDAKTAYQTTQGTDLPFYAFSLSYANVLYGAQYSNGNITKMEWLNKDDAAFTRGLAFTYDKANRLLASVKPAATTYTYVDTENGITYDKNGNIKSLVRAGAAVDNLTYTYAGNRLSAINDASGSNSGVKSGASNYSYDANGNMLTDGNRGATLSYNYLNLPKTVNIGGKTFQYDYDASGAKHRYAGDTVNVKYAGRFEYDGNNTLKRIATSEGQVVPSGDTLRFDYFLKDHLGNVRVVWDEFGNILQKNDYYPFGLEIDRNSPATSTAARNGVNRFNFQGQEKQIGSDYVQFKWRLHDPLTGRFLSVDPLSEKYVHNSTYAFSENKVVNHRELEGLEGVLSIYSPNDAQASDRRAIYSSSESREIGLRTTIGLIADQIPFIGEAKSFAEGDYAGVALGIFPLVKEIKGIAKGIDVTNDAIKTIDGIATGSHEALTSAKLSDSHHIIQDAAVKDLPGYSRQSAPAVQLSGPSTKVGSPHYNATQAQRKAGGGTYGAERKIAYRALLQSGISSKTAKTLIRQADEFFKKLGVSFNTETRIPGNRAKQ